MEMNVNEEKLLEELGKFREKVDKILVGKTPKLEGEMNDLYDVDIYIYRHPGMGNSKQLITGSIVGIWTATASYLETLMRQGLFTKAQLEDIVEMAAKAVEGRLD